MILYLAVLTGLLFAVPGHTHTAPLQIKRVVIFGDSLTDTGKTSQLTSYLTRQGEKPAFFDTLIHPLWGWLRLPISLLISPSPPEPYFKGRFSNGPLSAELLTSMLGLDPDNPDEVLNLSFGGGWSLSASQYLNAWLWHNPNVSWPVSLKQLVSGPAKWLIPSSQKVVDRYLASNPVLQPDTVYAITSGANDYQNNFWCPEYLASQQLALMEKLINHGARHLAWGTMPDLAMTPCMRSSPDAQVMSSRLDRHNSSVRTGKEQLMKRYPEVKIIFLDSYEALNLFFKNSHQLGLVQTDRGCTNVTIPGCFDHAPVLLMNAKKEQIEVCDDPDAYFFWDSLHPTARVSEFLASYLCVVAGLNGYQTYCRLPDKLRQPQITFFYDLMMQSTNITDITNDRNKVITLFSN